MADARALAAEATAAAPLNVFVALWFPTTLRLLSLDRLRVLLASSSTAEAEPLVMGPDGARTAVRPHGGGDLRWRGARRSPARARVLARWTRTFS